MQIFRTDRPLTPSWSLVQPSIELVKKNIWPVVYLAFLPSLVTTVGLVLMQHAAGIIDKTKQLVQFW